MSLPIVKVWSEFDGYHARYETPCGYVERLLPEWTKLNRIRAVVREYLALPFKRYKLEVME